MPVQMTRAEYQAKYGQPAPVATTSVPVKMTRAEYQAKYGTQPGSQATESPQAPSLGSQLAKRQGAIVDTAKRAFTGKQELRSAVFDAAGQGFGAIGDAGTAVADVAMKATGLDKPLAKFGEKIASIPGVSTAVDTAKSTYETLSPENKAHIDAIAGFASGAGALEGAGILKTPAKVLAKATLKPVIKATGKTTEKVARNIATVTTGVPKDVLERAASPDHASRIERAITHIDENPKEPFHELASRAATQINAADSGVSKALGDAKREFTSANPKATFDVRPAAPKIIKALEPFRSSGLTVDPMSYRIIPTAQSPFTKNEVEQLNSLLGKLRDSHDIKVDDVLALRQSFNTAYDAVPLGVNGQPRPYHAAIMAMKGAAESGIDELLPPALKDAFQKYSLVQDMKTDFGNRVIDAEGNMKPNAEQFLANIGNMNKGQVRATVDMYKQMLGLDLVGETQAVKDAMKLSQLFPSTGSRTQDVMRSILATGLGSVSAGPFGAAAGAAVTSPKLVGKAFLKVGTNREKAAVKLPQKSQSKSLQPSGTTTKYPIAAQKTKSNISASVAPKATAEDDFFKSMPGSKETESAYRPDTKKTLPKKRPSDGQRGMIRFPSFRPKAQVSALLNATNALKAGSATIKPGAIERAMKELKAGTSHPVRVRKLPNGEFIIEDGRHRLEAARRLGIRTLPIEDVTHLY